MWNISLDQAAEMYARFLKSRYGSKAADIAASKAIELRKNGDVEGELIWAKVKRTIEGRST